MSIYSPTKKSDRKEVKKMKKKSQINTPYLILSRKNSMHEDK
jgi:hypothetical protein